MKYWKKPIVVDATQWFKNGDHPDDGPSLYQGAIVQYFRDPATRGDTICSKCGLMHHQHGWIDTLEGGHNVCPGDWIITGVEGEHYPCKPSIFEKTYELAEFRRIRPVGKPVGLA